MDSELQSFTQNILQNANFVLRFSNDQVTPITKNEITAFTRTITPCMHITAI
ncbi:unnamed protein product [Brugia timori]|uniref:ATP-binding protein n=1 Tax=Brugia timori TaxID=42155 RepID=A0A0R3QV10_9BILA|nr:unnamed protein product [Brugia timori]